VISRALTSDSGEYWCQAINAVGVATGTPFSVTVDPPGKPLQLIQVITVVIAMGPGRRGPCRMPRAYILDRTCVYRKCEKKTIGDGSTGPDAAGEVAALSMTSSGC